MQKATVVQKQQIDMSVRYGGLFRRTLARAVQKSLDNVKAHQYTVPEEVREQAWHMLKLLFEGDELWEEASQLLIELAPRMEMAGFREDWLNYLTIGVKRSIEFEDASSEAELKLLVGMLLRLLGNHEEAMRNLQVSYELFGIIDEKIGQAKVRNQMAYLMFHRFNFDIAEQYAHEGLSLAIRYYQEKAESLSILGLIITERTYWQKDNKSENLRMAEEYHQEALEIRMNIGDHRKVAWSLQNIGYTLRMRSRFKEAIKHYEEACSILSKLNDPANLAIVKMNIGLANQALGKPRKALETYRHARLVFQRLHDQLNVGRIHVNEGLSFLELSEPNCAEKSFQEAIRIFQLLKNDSLRLNAIDGWALSLIAQHDYRTAIEVLNIAIAELSQLPDLPNYQYLYQSMNTHLTEAKSFYRG
ncbi:MAG: tetratricopeptide repeat protein [Chloroflexota bacterium]